MIGQVYPTRERLDDVLAANAVEAFVEIGEAAPVAAVTARFMTWRGLVARLGGSGHHERVASPTWLRAVLARQASPWSVDALRRTLQRLRQADIVPADLARAAATVPGPRGDRLAALAALFATVEAELVRTGQRDADAAELDLARATDDLDARPFTGLEIVDLIDLPPVRRRLLVRLSQVIETRLVLPHGDGRTAVRAPLLRALGALERSGANRLEIDHRDLGAPGSVAAALFADDRQVRAEAQAIEVRIIDAANRMQEAAAMARAVGAAIDRGTPPSSVAVGLRRPSRDGPLIARALRDAGLPVYSRLSLRGADGSAARWLLAALDMALDERGYERDAFADLIASPTIDRTGAARRGARRAVEQLGVRVLRATDLARRLDAEHRWVLSLLDRLERFAGRMGDHPDPWREVRLLIEQLGLARDVDQAWGSTEIDWARAADRRALELFVALLDELDDVEGLSATAIVAVLKSRLVQVRTEPARARSGAIEIADVRDLIGRSFDLVALPFVVDGTFPQDRRPLDGILEEPDQRAINEALGREALDPMPAAEDPLLFALAVEAARQTLIVSHDRADGTEARPASFVDEVRRRAPNIHETRLPATPIPPIGAVRTERDLRLVAAWAGADELLPETFRHRVVLERARGSAFATSGDVGADPIASRIAARLHRAGADAPISAGRIERIANCTLGYFLKDVLDLDERRAASIGLEPLDFGQLAHTVLEALYRWIVEHGQLSVPPVARIEAIAVALDDILADQARRMFGARAINAAHRRVYAAEIERLRRRILHLVATEIARQGVGHDPVDSIEVEVAFGRGAALLKVPSPDGRDAACLSGRIDRIDRRGGEVDVIDYKTGSAYRVHNRLSPGKLLESEFQLAIYAAFALSRPGTSRVDGAYLAVGDARRTKALSAASRGDFGVAPELMLALEPEVRNGLRQGRSLTESPSLADRIWALVEQTRAGRFVPRCPRRSDCRTPGLCRYPEDVRVDDDLDEDIGP